MRAGALAIVIACALAGCGGDEPPPAPATEDVSVCDAVAGETPAAPLAIRGSVIQLSDLGAAAHPGSVTGFVLEADGCSIFVAGPSRSSVTGLEPGEELIVRGALRTLDDVEAERIHRILDLPSDAEAIDEGVSAPTPISDGAPFIDAFSLSGDSEVPGATNG